MRQLLALTVAILTAACTATFPPQPQRSSDRSTAALPVPTSRPGAAGGGMAPVPVPRPGRSEDRPFDLDRLGGATESDVLGMIGDPDEIRPQPPGKVWVYDHGSCRVEVYLYPSVDVGSMAVLGTAMVPPGLPTAERDRCRRELAHRATAKQ